MNLQFFNKRVVTVLIGVGLALFIACEGDEKEPLLEDDGTVYFKVGEMSPAHGDSFILPLSDPEEIAHARSLIQNQDQDGRLIVAKVVAASANNTYQNRDLNNDRVWSWKVSEFLQFADNTIEILDGGPSDVEDMAFWFPNTNNGSTTEGVIGFWNYTIVAEVDAEEVK